MPKGLLHPESQTARCWSCGYLLRDIQGPLCPECARPFDPANPASMYFGRPIGPIGHWALRKLGRVPLLLAVIATGALLWTTRWPPDGWKFSFLDLSFYANLPEWRRRTPSMSAVDIAYTAGLLIFALVLTWLFFRSALRLLFMLRHQPPLALRGKFWTRSLLIFLMALVSTACIGMGWPYRIGQRWAREWETGQLSDRSFLPLVNRTNPAVPVRAIVLHASTPRQRRSGIKLMVETWLDQDMWKTLAEVFKSETDLDNKLLAIHLAGTIHSPEIEPVLAALLIDSSSPVRTAAADALGIYWNHSSDMRHDVPGDTIEGDPPVECPISSIIGADDPNPPAGTRDRLVAMMTGAVSLDERQAAARALARSPQPGYQLRYAEWGVLIGQGRDQVKFTNALPDDVPPFAHRIGNPVKELEDRITNMNPRGWGKPVIHLTADRPMGVELVVCMQEGRPWIAYPRFDDLILVKGRFGQSHNVAVQNPVSGPRGSIRTLDPHGVPPLKDLREGYPWATPNHREYDWFDATGKYHGTPDSEPLADVNGLGIIWQNLIVTPQPLSTDRLADIPDERRFDWWKNLRKTPCSWVSSRGETERFLYYDGPTTYKAPVVVTLEKGVLKWQFNRGMERPFEPIRHYKHTDPSKLFEPPPPDTTKPALLYLDVHGKSVKGFWISQDQLNSSPEGEENLAERSDPIGVIESAGLTARLIEQGLNQAEADALVNTWKKQFFQTDGRRALVILEQSVYESMCPMSMLPWPTHLARVGIVWTEFP